MRQGEGGDRARGTALGLMIRRLTRAGRRFWARLLGTNGIGSGGHDASGGSGGVGVHGPGLGLGIEVRGRDVGHDEGRRSAGSRVRALVDEWDKRRRP